MKPTWANSTSANATVTERKPMSRRAWARICVAEEALAAAATAACDRCGGLPTKISTAGTTSASMTRCRDHHRRREAEMADRDD